MHQHSIQFNFERSAQKFPFWIACTRRCMAYRRRGDWRNAQDTVPNGACFINVLNRLCRLCAVDGLSTVCLVAKNYNKISAQVAP